MPIDEEKLLRDPSKDDIVAHLASKESPGLKISAQRRMRGWFCFRAASGAAELILWRDEEDFTHAEVSSSLPASTPADVIMIKLYLTMLEDKLYWYSQVSSDVVSKIWQDRQRFLTCVDQELRRITGASTECIESQAGA